MQPHGYYGHHAVRWDRDKGKGAARPLPDGAPYYPTNYSLIMHLEEQSQKQQNNEIKMLTLSYSLLNHPCNCWQAFKFKKQIKKDKKDELTH